MKIRILITVAVCLIATVLFSCAGDRTEMTDNNANPVSPIMPYTLTTLDNGLDVIVKEVHSVPIVAVHFWCNTGSINETDREHGISHFYEHMFFKGTEKRGVGEMNNQITGLGGYNNAGTSHEITLYYVALPSENFSLAADILVDAIRNSTFDEAEVEKELGVIKEEINRSEDDPSGLMRDEIYKILFPDTPYSHKVLGTRESVSGLTPEDFKNYLAKYYVPNNMTAVVVGDVDTDEAVEEIRKLTEGWEPDETVTERLADFEVPRQEGVHELILEKDVNMSYVLMAFQTAGLTDKRENAALDVASSILSEGRSSRLYKRIVEDEQIASSVSAYINPMTRTGMFMVSGTMDEQNVPKFREVVLDEIEKLRSGSPDPAELEKVKTMLKADFQFSNETNSDIAQTLGYYSTIGMLEKATEYEKSIDMVTIEELNTYVNKTLTPDSYSIVIVNQRDEGEKEARGE
jgi:zinc protease